MDEQKLEQTIVRLLKEGLTITFLKEPFGEFRIDLSKQILDNKGFYMEQQMLPLDETHPLKISECLIFMESKLLSSIRD